ncbi:MAG: cytochrome c [Pseudolabrys sp.]|nr:cytochrome c [Pseudolabrys sp.]
MSRWVDAIRGAAPHSARPRESGDPEVNTQAHCKWLLGPRFRGDERRVRLLAIVVLLTLSAPAFAQTAKPQNYGIGTPATAAQIAGWDIDVRPDGQGLPPGKGSVKDGETLYLERCAACHGEFGESAGRWPQLAQGKGTLATHDPVKTVGSYFPYVSSVFDYVRRAMPFGDAQSLTNDELYAIVAFVLNLNDIVDDKFVLSKETWSQVKMPNAGGFYEDDRDTTEKAFWNKNPCMKECRPPVKITGHASVIDVTPDDATARKSGVE